jgi:hypothetical protein
MTKLTQAQRNTLAYVTITNSQKHVRIKTLVAIHSFRKLEVRTEDGLYFCEYVLTEEGKGLTWGAATMKGHIYLTNLGYKIVTRHRNSPACIHYENDEKVSATNHKGLVYIGCDIAKHFKNTK